jgi:hypothetical protein
MNDRRPLIFLVITVLAITAGYAYMVYGTPIPVQGATNSGSSSTTAETPYGEKLEISLGSGAETSGTASFLELRAPETASWFASYDDTDSQNVYEVNGTYKSQELVTMEYSLSVTHANVASITATVKIKAYEKGTPSNNNEYTLANGKSLSGGSPIADSGSTVPSILQHLTDVGGSTTNEVVGYDIYCQVTATGTISGDTLTATIPYTHFGAFSFTQSSESSTAQVTPTISAASWDAENPWRLSYYDDAVGAPEGTVMTVLTAFVVLATISVIGWNEMSRR